MYSGDDTFHVSEGSNTSEVTISGTIDLACATSCSSTPDALADVTVEAKGDDSYTATTDTDGKYELKVPRGAYTITSDDPDLTFTPASRDVGKDGPYDGQDFDVCTASSDNPVAQMRVVGRADEHRPQHG